MSECNERKKFIEHTRCEILINNGSILGMWMKYLSLKV